MNVVHFAVTRHVKQGYEQAFEDADAHHALACTLLSPFSEEDRKKVLDIFTLT
jgi:hypothetical protein